MSMFQMRIATGVHLGWSSRSCSSSFCVDISEVVGEDSDALVLGRPSCFTQHGDIWYQEASFGALSGIKT